MPWTIRPRHQDRVHRAARDAERDQRDQAAARRSSCCRSPTRRCRRARPVPKSLRPLVGTARPGHRPAGWRFEPPAPGTAPMKTPTREERTRLTGRDSTSFSVASGPEDDVARDQGPAALDTAGVLDLGHQLADREHADQHDQERQPGRQHVEAEGEPLAPHQRVGADGRDRSCRSGRPSARGSSSCPPGWRRSSWRRRSARNTPTARA